MEIFWIYVGLAFWGDSTMAEGGGALQAPPLASLASLRLSREPYATARQFA